VSNPLLFPLPERLPDVVFPRYPSGRQDYHRHDIPSRRGQDPPCLPHARREWNVPRQRYYKVYYDLYAIFEDRNLRYEARYPANESGKVQKAGQISIAAAFRPGTG